ncbi:MAG: sugar transferase [Candidatus Sungbacteria bacterium]|nr:sugar transferase [Candidatus Sungbacteria bacterium]
MKQRGKVLILLAGDLIIWYGTLWLTLFFRYYPTEDILELLELHAVPFSIVFFAWAVFFGAFGLYDLRFIKNSKIFLYRLIWVGIINTLVAVLILYSSLPIFEIEPRRNLLMITLISTILMATWRYCFNALVIRAPADRVIFFGANQETVDLAEYLLKNPQLGQKPAAFIVNGGSNSIGDLPLPVISLSQQNFLKIVQDTKANTVVISPVMKENRELVKSLFQVVPMGVNIVEFPSFHEMLTGKISLYLIEEVWFLENLIGGRNTRYEFFKRVLDILFSVAVGALALILFPLIALGIFISNPRDILRYKQKRARPGDGIFFFRQERVGKNGRIFNFVKFRSQVLGAERLSAAMNETKEAINDPRQYAFGTFMRKSYLDELGQVWNVLKGEMSFVGPRPERPQYVEKLKEKVPFYEMRLLVKPGITGWAQINMENDAAVDDAPEKMQYDLYYIKNRSLILDLLIALRTVFSILGRRGR